MANPPNQEDTLDLFDESLRKLKIQYDLFFAGVRKLPPTEERKRLNAMVHELAKTRMRDNGLRFRFNTLLGKFNQFQELWGRKMREREEGPTDYRRRVAALNAEPTPPPEREPQPRPTVTGGQDDSYVRVSGTTTEDGAKRLYEQIAQAQKTLGKAGMSLGQIEQIVRSQTETLRSRYSVDEVGFRVEIVDGKVKLKAKPFQKGS